MARSSSLAAAAALVLLLASAAPVAQAATDCLGALISANAACTSEIAALRDGKALPASVGAGCCKAASSVFSAAFGADCACAASIAPYKALLDGAAEALAGKCGAATKIAALPACSGGARVAASAAVAAAPTWGPNSICVQQAESTCRVKCTPRNVATPSTAQINRAKTCATRTNGFCNGLGVNGATQGTSQCGTGVPVNDPNSQGRTCFKCCTLRLAPTGSATRGRNACVNPNRGGGGGGGGGGGCFPGSATATLESGEAVAVRDLKIGDKVLSADPNTGKTSFETVYFFGHSLEGASSEFVRLEVEAVEGSKKALELTRKHLVPTLPGPVYKRAMDVAVGDVVLVVAADGDKTAEARVASSSFVSRTDGLFAPLTTGGGHIVVEGVVSSVHSNNMLDPLGELLDRRDLLQWAYETFGASVLKAAYRVAGPEVMQKAAPIVAGLGLGDAAQLAVGVRGLLMGQQAPAQAAKSA